MTDLEGFPRQHKYSNLMIHSQDAQRWQEDIEVELLQELAPKINPAYDGWGDCVSDAKVAVYLRVLGLTKKEAWERIKELKIPLC